MDVLEKLLTVAQELGDKRASAYLDFNDEEGVVGTVVVNGIIVDVHSEDEKPYSIYDNKGEIVYSTKQPKRMANKCINDDGSLSETQRELM